MRLSNRVLRVKVVKRRRKKLMSSRKRRSRHFLGNEYRLMSYSKLMRHLMSREQMKLPAKMINIMITSMLLVRMETKRKKKRAGNASNASSSVLITNSSLLLMLPFFSLLLTLVSLHFTMLLLEHPLIITIKCSIKWLKSHSIQICF